MRRLIDPCLRLLPLCLCASIACNQPGTGGPGSKAGSTVPGKGSSSGKILSAPPPGAWQDTGSAREGRANHTATLLGSGKVLLVGSGGSSGTTAELFDAATGSSTSTGPLATGRSGAAAVMLGSGKVLVTGGQTSSGATGSCELFDPATGTFSVTGSLAIARQNHVAIVLQNGKVLAAGGAGPAGAAGSAELYDPAAGTWSSAGNLVAPGYQQAAALLPDGRVIVTGGFDAVQGKAVASTQFYTPSTGTWVQGSAMGQARSNHTLTVLPSGNLLVVGGSSSPVTELFDPNSSAPFWAQVGSLSVARSGHTATLLPNGRVLVSGGTSDGTTSLSTSEQFDAAGGWSAAASLKTGRFGHTATLLASGKVLVEGGYGAAVSPTTTAEIFDPYNPQFFPVNSPAIDRISSAAVMLPSGLVLVAGGSGDLGPVSDAELYDVSTSSFTATGSLTDARQFPTATLLLSGEVLVVGGIDVGGSPLGTAELYNPALGTFTPTGALVTPRYLHSTTLLADGRVLVAGGEGTAGHLTSSEVFDPLVGTWSAAGNLATARLQHTATLLADGEVLVVGGRLPSTVIGVPDTIVATAELFDTSTRAWHATTNAPISGRAQHVAARLPSGKVLIASGGTGPLGASYSATAELYDPANGTFSPTGSMRVPRYNATATVLASGRVAVIGGFADIPASLLNDELYDPATGVFFEDYIRFASAVGHTATLLTSNHVLVQGGVIDGSTTWAEEFAEGHGAGDTWTPTLVSPPTIATLGQTLSLQGTLFKGVSGASGGSSADSSTNYPLLNLQAIDSGAAVYAGPATFTSTGVSATVPLTFPAGHAFVRVVVNGVPSHAAVVAILPLLQLTPSTAQVKSGQGKLFVGAGGTRSGYQYAVLDNQSGATIGAGSGAYLAGPTAGVKDILQVTDSSGAKATSLVDVLPNLVSTPGTVTAPPRGQQQFVATGAVPKSTFSWAVTTDGSGGATIDATGLYTAGSTGSSTDVITVTATSAGISVSATSTITISAPLSIVPPTATVIPGATRQLSTTGGSGGQVLTWSVTGGSGGSVTASGGLYTAGRAGNTTDIVQAVDSLGNIATATITVGPGVTITPSAVSVAPLGTKTFSAAGGSGVGFVWSLTAKPSGGSINAQGLYTAGSTGGTTDAVKVVDSLGNIGTASVSVGGGLVVSPSSATVAPRGTQQLSPSGGSGSGYTFTFVSNGSGATLTLGGLYTAGPTGSKTDVVRVTDSLGASVNVTITVSAGLTLSPSAITLAPGATQLFTTAGGSGAGLTWTVSVNSSGGSITQAGSYTAGSKGGGTDTVRVTDSLGNSATVVITLTASLAISPTTANAFPLQSLTLTASGGSGAGFSWVFTTNGSGGTISSTGAYKAGTTGSTSDVLKVTDGNGNTATVTITVGPAVTITPATATVAPKGTKALTATGGSGTGFSWSIATNGSGCSVNASGVYTAGPTGATTDIIKVTDSLGNIKTATLSVSGGLAITPATLSLPPKQSRQLAVSGGSGTGYTWSITTNGSGGAITDTGLYTAGAVGSSTDTVSVVDSLGSSATLNVIISAALTVSPPSLTVSPRESKSLTVTGGSGTGYGWTVAINGSGSSIDQAGKYTAGPNGGVVELVKVTDSLGNVANVTVTVGPGVAVTPGVARVPPRGSKQLAAAGGSGSYTWAIDSTNGSGGSITATGLYTAGPSGATVDTIKVTDTLGNFARAAMTVTDNVSILPGSQQLPPRSSQIFTASGGTALGFTWVLTANGSGATLSTTVGNPTATYQAGTTGDKADTLMVTDSLGNSASVTVQVTAALTVSPTAASLAPRATQKIIASGGNGVYAYAITAGSTGGGLVSSTGIYTAGNKAAGVDTVVISDTLGNSATAVFTITTALTISPAALALAPLGSQKFAGAGGSGAGYSYSLVDTSASGGSVNPSTGLYTAGPRGGTKDAVRVTDSLGNIATAAITVTPALSVSPATGSVPPRGKQQLTAAGGQTPYAWKMVPGSGSGGTVSSSGLYTAGSNGVTTDTVQVTDALGATATASFTVTVGLSISPTSLEAVAKTQYQFTVAGGDGNYTWTLSKNDSGGTITGNPTAEGHASGTYTAGTKGNTNDVLTVTDGNGNEITASIKIAPIPVRATGCGCGAADGGTALEFFALGLGLLWQRRRAKASKR